jgi:TRAP-type mannitol/chloroaromatic compound transport system substrate-binding protein
MKPITKRIHAAAIAAVVLTFTCAAHAQQKVRINLANAFPNSLTLIGEAPVKLAQKLNRLSAGTIELRVNEPGALVPALQAIQATGQGSVDAAWSNAGFFAGTDSAFNMFASVPFGPGIPEYLAWIHHGGGLQLSREMFAKHGVHNIPCAIIPPEASGWFRKEIKTVQDLKGLKMRFFGLGAKAMAKLGVATQLLAPGDIFQALQLGTLDATEFSLPVMDQKLGFHQVAKFYYFPGWHQQATFLEFYINQKKWASLSEQHKAMIESACGDLTRDVIAEGEATQWKAMVEMRDKNGVQIKKWPPEFIAAFDKAWHEVIAEESAANPQFKRVYASYQKFRDDYGIWREHGYLK